MQKKTTRNPPPQLRRLINNSIKMKTFTFTITGRDDAKINLSFEVSKQVTNLEAFLVNNIYYRLKGLLQLKYARLIKRSETLAISCTFDGVKIDTAKLAGELLISLKGGKAEIESGKLKEKLKEVIQGAIILSDSTDYTNKKKA